LPEVSLPVRVDRNELEIALLNLVLNARDAMSDGGTIRIGVTGKTLRSEAAAPHELDGDFVSITVSDTGQGIPEEIRDRVFEPYFTTKKPDKGTGLGLSQVYGFARQSEGAVTFETMSGRGTTFTLLLPRSREPLHQEQPPTAPVDIPEPRRVLLVEDNPDVAVIAQDYLKQCGCTVVHADSAEVAIELLKTDPDIALVFSDIVMPGMNGLELARLVRDHYPGIGLILASGYSEKAALALAEGFALLNKPYSLDTLRQALARASGRSRAAA
jgi:two-component system NtrC family sensor kinase